MPDEQTSRRINRLVPSDVADDVVGALESLGGEAQRADIINRAVEIGGWTTEERDVRSRYQGAARTYHLRTIADYAVTLCRERGLIEQADARGRWRLAGPRALVPHPFGRTFTIAVGLGDDPVPDGWRATDQDHVWLSQRSNQVSRGDHLFVLGAGRNSAVLGLYEVQSAGASTQPRNPWDPERWPYAIAVRALAAVPPRKATSVTGVIAPRRTANAINDEPRRSALYGAVQDYVVGNRQAAGNHQSSDAWIIGRPRPFDPRRPPTPPNDASARRADPEETLALQEQARRGHHQILVRLQRELEALGWSDSEEIPGSIDLRARRPDRARVIFEAKTITEHNEIRQTRAAVAQLLEYRQEHGDPDDLLCIAVDREPSARRLEILERLGIPVIAPSGALRGLNESGAALLRR